MEFLNICFALVTCTLEISWRARAGPKWPKWPKSPSFPRQQHNNDDTNGTTSGVAPAMRALTLSASWKHVGCFFCFCYHRSDDNIRYVFAYYSVYMCIRYWYHWYVAVCVDRQIDTYRCGWVSNSPEQSAVASPKARTKQQGAALCCSFGVCASRQPWTPGSFTVSHDFFFNPDNKASININKHQ